VLQCRFAKFFTNKPALRQWNWMLRLSAEATIAGAAASPPRVSAPKPPSAPHLARWPAGRATAAERRRRRLCALLSLSSFAIRDEDADDIRTRFWDSFLEKKNSEKFG
jgi:hypothetical protein